MASLMYDTGADEVQNSPEGVHADDGMCRARAHVQHGPCSCPFRTGDFLVAQKQMAIGMHAVPKKGNQSARRALHSCCGNPSLTCRAVERVASSLQCGRSLKTTHASEPRKLQLWMGGMIAEDWFSAIMSPLR